MVNNNLFIIFGLHRSGTSATAGVLHHLGVNMGRKMLKGAKSNPKGHFENIEFLKINDYILSSVQSSWDHPPLLSEIENTEIDKNILRQFVHTHQSQYWGLKDPRALLTYNLWKPFLEESSTITYIFVYRPFEESVKSLVNRNGFSVEKSKNILNLYLEQRERLRINLAQEHADIIDISFDQLLINPADFVNHINSRINQAPNNQMVKVKQFLDKNLKNF
ncbi:sulfotransferase family protein [Cytobacillus firmus]|uniref:sulfotransferase family protein n=1 Tax=Cytobacillus firmus TaxID=1399 RepID=UPI0030005FF3